MRVTTRMVSVLLLIAVSGCPIGPPESAGAAAPRDGASLTAAAGNAAELGGDALDDLVQQAVRDRFPPPPSLDTLCRLVVGETDFNAAKQILGEPQSQSQDATMAGLSYRFRPEDSGAGGAGGSRAELDDQEAITLYLSFAWSDGQVGIGTAIFGIGGDPEDFIEGYVLSRLSITGVPYPGCWPHEEE